MSGVESRSDPTRANVFIRQRPKLLLPYWRAGGPRRFQVIFWNIVSGRSRLLGLEAFVREFFATIILYAGMSASYFLIRACGDK